MDTEQWVLRYEDDFSRSDALNNWFHEGRAELSINDEQELFIDVVATEVNGQPCTWSTLWYREPIWGDARYVIKARGEETGMRLFFFNAQAAGDDRNIFSWQREIPDWSSYTADPRLQLYTSGMLRFNGELNVRCIGGDLADVFQELESARENRSPDFPELENSYSAKEMLWSGPTPYSDTEKVYEIDIRVIGNRMSQYVDGKLVFELEDQRRSEQPLQGGYFGLRNFKPPTRTWYQSIEVYSLAAN